MDASPRKGRDETGEEEVESKGFSHPNGIDCAKVEFPKRTT
jgi:hypothetical protein